MHHENVKLVIQQTRKIKHDMFLSYVLFTNSLFDTKSEIQANAESHYLLLLPSPLKL